MREQKHRSRTRKIVPGGAAPAVLSLEEVHALYAGFWVLLRVAAFDATQCPSAGQVVCHGSHSKVLKQLAQLLESKDPAQAPFYVLAAGNQTLAAAAPAQTDGTGRAPQR